MKTGLIEMAVVEGKPYYTTTARGVEYCAHELAGRWFVATRRLALGRGHLGGGRYYETLAEVAEKCKPFAGLDLLVELH